MSAALRALLDHVVDYAGLYPPANLDVVSAAQNYAAYRSSDDKWMLGRFVVGVAKLGELRAVIRSLRPAQSGWPLTVVAPDAAAGTGAMRAANDATMTIESIAVNAKTPADVALLSRAADVKRELYVEVALDNSLDGMLDAIAAAKLRAKVRTGGVTPDAVPATADVVRFLRGCIDREIPFKATAGLHHPLRGTYRLTYAPDAATGSMFGFLNVFLAATLLRGSLSDDDARALLEETDESAFTIGDQSIGWRDHIADLDAIVAARLRAATSFGSCSFREPVDELPFSTVGA